MPRFDYSAYDAAGKLVRGELESASDVEVLDHLAARGLTPVEVREGGDATPWWAREFSLTGSGGALKQAEQERFFTTLAALLQARFPLPQSLRFCASQARDPRSRTVARRLQSAVENGASLRAAMADASPAFPDRLVTLMGVGESSNTLADVAARTARMLGAEAALRRELRGALIYPMILLVMSALVMALIVFYLVPTLVPVFRTAGAELPAPLRLMSGLRSAVLEFWPLILAIAGGIAALSVLARRAMARMFRALGRRLPVIGPYLRQRSTLDMCQTLALMLSSGATLTQALNTARNATGNPAMRDMLSEASDTITAGGTLSETLVGHPLVDQMAATLMQAGEEADRLPEVLDTVTRDLGDRTRRTLAQMIQMLTPILTLLIGFSVGAVILSTISAIMDLNDIAL